MYTIVGIEKRSGVYEGRAYDNTILHCTYMKQDATNTLGLCVATFKVKSAICPTVNLGDSVDPLYDRFGNVAHLSVAPAKK